MEKRTMGMPGVEFEGPMGMFWSMKEVPFEAMIQGIAEIIRELLVRGYKQDIVWQAIKEKSSKHSHQNTLKEIKMELNEIMRLIWQSLSNVPKDAPEREKAIRALCALESHMNYTSPSIVMELNPDGYRHARLK